MRGCSDVDCCGCADCRRGAYAKGRGRCLCDSYTSNRGRCRYGSGGGTYAGASVQIRGNIGVTGCVGVIGHSGWSNCNLALLQRALVLPDLACRVRKSNTVGHGYGGCACCEVCGDGTRLGDGADQGCSDHCRLGTGQDLRRRDEACDHLGYWL